MPSLKQLEDFKKAFENIGFEKTILEQAGIRHDAYELPSTEPVPLPKPSSADEDDGGDFDISDGLSDFAGVAEHIKDEVESPAIPEPQVPEPQIPEPQIPEPQIPEPQVPEPQIPEPEVPEPDLSISDEGGTDGADGTSDFSPDIDFGDLNLDGDTGSDTAGDTEGAVDSAGGGDGAADGTDGFSPDIDLADLNLDGDTGESLDIQDAEIPSVTGVSDEEMSSMFPDAPPIEDEPPPVTIEDEQQPVAIEDEMPPVADEGDAASDEETPPPLDDFLGDLDLDIPPIDQVPKAPKAVAPSAEKEEKIEAVNLSREDLQNLLDTIASYPLNLRIATEKVIAEEVVPPAQLSALLKLLINGASARETAALIGKILKKKIDLPKSFKSGEDLEDEQKSFEYIFINKFFPIARLAFLIAALIASIIYLSYNFIYKPIKADIIYKQGYKLISEGEYSLANQRFSEAFKVHHAKDWFYKYAEGFRDEHQYILAQDKYDNLLLWYPHDKKGALDYALMEKDYRRNYEKADNLVRANILDYKVNDPDGLLLLGDINLDWGEYDYSRYEEARMAYAKYITAWGQSDPILERMLKYFIRTDQLGEVIPLQMSFMGNKKSKIAAATLAELGGYLLDKHFEKPDGVVPDENVERIGGIKDVLLRAVETDYSLPESHYHLARYYNNYGALVEERQTLQNAAASFDAAKLETPKRSTYRIDTQRRIAAFLVKAKEFFPAEEALTKGINIYEDALERRILTPDPKFGMLYADLGDLEYFVKKTDKEPNMQEAIGFYLDAERNLYAPSEIQYRMGSAYYHLGQYRNAQDRFWNVLMEIPYNRRLLNAMGNVSYMNSDYYAAQGYFKKLLDLLEADRDRFPVLQPQARPEHKELLERMMRTRNNLGVTLNALASRSGKSAYRAQALALFSESARAWDSLTRDQKTMIRPSALDPAVPFVGLPYLNIQHTLYPIPGDEGELFMQIDKDVNEPSAWEELAASSR
ncbi:MAG: hypothetical protein Ta2G_02540 [Termitinemataceae bacterium]|nr:MAG: hypothetical protein Ta2G_02540 [Termitinemataceae bacterium]